MYFHSQTIMRRCRQQPFCWFFFLCILSPFLIWINYIKVTLGDQLFFDAFTAVKVSAGRLDVSWQSGLLSEERKVKSKRPIGWKATGWISFSIYCFFSSCFRHIFYGLSHRLSQAFTDSRDRSAVISPRFPGRGGGFDSRQRAGASWKVWPGRTRPLNCEALVVTLARSGAGKEKASNRGRNKGAIRPTAFTSVPVVFMGEKVVDVGTDL